MVKLTLAVVKHERRRGTGSSRKFTVFHLAVKPKFTSSRPSCGVNQA